MLQKISHIIFSAFLAILLLFNGVAQEGVHQFIGHQDTIDIHNHSDHLHNFDVEHHHCSFLDTAILNYLEPNFSTINYFVDNIYKVRYIVCYVKSHSTSPSFHYQLRGPPIV